MNFYFFTLLESDVALSLEEDVIPENADFFAPHYIYGEKDAVEVARRLSLKHHTAISIHLDDTEGSFAQLEAGGVLNS